MRTMFDLEKILRRARITIAASRYAFQQECRRIAAFWLER